MPLEVANNRRLKEVVFALRIVTAVWCLRYKGQLCPDQAKIDSNYDKTPQKADEDNLRRHTLVFRY